MRPTIFAGVVLIALVSVFSPAAEPLEFRVTSDLPPASGRLLIVIAKSDRPEPRFTIGETGADAPPMLGRDVETFGAGLTVTVDRSAAIFPIESVDALAPGDYYVQALFDSNRDLASVNAPGNRY